jgi:hypothetical protein
MPTAIAIGAAIFLSRAKAKAQEVRRKGMHSYPVDIMQKPGVMPEPGRWQNLPEGTH